MESSQGDEVAAELTVEARPPTTAQRRRRSARRVKVGAAMVVAALGVVAVVQAVRAERVGSRGKDSLVQAEARINARDVDGARRLLLAARADFGSMQRDLGGLGPFGSLARVTPFVRVQLRGATAFARAGVLITDSGLHLVDAASAVLRPRDTHLRLADALAQLRRVRVALDRGMASLTRASGEIHAFDGLRLVGPIDSARHDLLGRLPRVSAKAASAGVGLDALIDVLGGSGPRRFLVLSQNPDEVRPTGGFIGTYGVLVSEGGHLSLESYDSTDNWYQARPAAVVAAADAPPPLRLNSPPQSQTIANVNATADFPAAARLATELWQRGGETPVDGVLALTPDVMVDVVRVLGPVLVPGYDEWVNSANLLERVDYHTHLDAVAQSQPSTRKAFLIELVHVVVQQLLDAPPSRWLPLSDALARGFNAREAMAWSDRPVIEGAIESKHWQGSLPSVGGDFFYDGEFEYTAKNGRGLRRDFEHHVSIHRDGSATVTTVVTIHNTLPRSESGLLNLDSLSLITIYGPRGGQLDPGSDPPDSASDPLSGHPAASWFESADPLSSTSFTVSWDVPGFVPLGRDGRSTYSLDFMRLPAHTGDTLHLTVDLPSGWKWAHGVPSRSWSLDHDVRRSWEIVRS